MDKYLIHERKIRGPATHALVIGVGDYPHLNAGGKALTQYHEGMKQLSSPPLCARAIAEWLISEYNNPHRQLASVALLLSERRKPQAFRNPASKKDFAVQEAIYDNVSEAIGGWLERGARNEKDLLIFYFCGHGTAKGSDVSLLLSDYGKNPNAPLDHAMDFRRFRLGMSLRLPRQQVYFLDTCRANSDTLITSFQHAGRVPVQPGSESAAEAPVFYATLLGDETYSKPNQVSAFTDAIIKGFRGTGSDDSEGNWRVTTTRLKEAIDYHVRQAILAGTPRAPVPPTDELTTFDLHHLKGEPQVPVVVTCQPESENSNANFSCQGTGVSFQRAPKSEEWPLVLPAGSYEFQASFLGGRREVITKKSWVRPVYRKVLLEVR